MQRPELRPSAPSRLPSARCRLPRLRRWAFRVLAVLVGLSPLVLCELVCVVGDWGRPDRQADPFVGFSAIHPLFVRDRTGTKYEIPPSRQSHFCYDSFLAHKPPEEFRIFVLGGSTVQGRPYFIETSFTTWLELALQAAAPERTWQVVNCGGVSYATYRLLPILQEVLRYQPDLIVFYEGHNEFLEDRTYAHIKHLPAWMSVPHAQVARFRSYHLLRAGLWRLLGWHDWTGTSPRNVPPRPRLGPEVDARLDWQGGLDAYHRDPAWQRDVVAHFRFNLERAVALCRAARVPLILANPVANLDWHPFKSEHRADLTEAERRQFEALQAEARALYTRDLPAAAGKLREAVAIDDQHAGIHYTLGKCLQAQGLLAEARGAFVRARDLDVCPLRILTPMHAIVHDVARRTRTPLVDADALFAARSPGGIPGPDWLVDHVHPSIEGHQVLAEEFARVVLTLQHRVPEPGWEARREALFRRHLEGLDKLYFVHGQQRLHNEQRWAHGFARQRRGQEPDFSETPPVAP